MAQLISGPVAGPTATHLPAAAAWRAVLVAWALGALLLFVAGFAGAAALHDAAHDSRHSFTFPCH